MLVPHVVCEAHFEKLDPNGTLILAHMRFEMTVTRRV